MKYAKLVNGKPSYAPNPILHNGLWYGNPPAQLLMTMDYKRLERSDPPEVPPGYVAVQGWVEETETIREVWTLRELTDEDEISDTEALDMLMGGDSA